MKTPLLVFAALAVLPGAAGAADWITAPSYFTHSPQTGERVAQYSPIGPVYVPQRPDYMQSGYRHTRSSLQAGNSIDHLHLVEEWGRPARPYGEWRYPYRPYSVPYDAWGPPFGGFGGPFGVFPGLPFFGGAAGGYGAPGNVAPATYPPSGLDEVYPDIRFRTPGAFP